MSKKTLIEKEFEIRTKIKCWVEPLDKSAAADDLKTYQNVDELYQDQTVWLQVERQQRLFNLLLENKNIIEALLKSDAIDLLNDSHEIFKGNNLDITDILKELSLKLDKPSDIEYFREAEQEGLFSESLDHIYNRFKSEIISIDISDISA